MKRKITVVMAVELDVEGEGDKMQLARDVVATAWATGRLPRYGASGDTDYTATAIGLLRVSEEKR